MGIGVGLAAGVSALASGYSAYSSHEQGQEQAGMAARTKEEYEYKQDEQRKYGDWQHRERKADIKESAADAKEDLSQSMIGRGLYDSSVYDTGLAGIEEDMDDALEQANRAHLHSERMVSDYQGPEPEAIEAKYNRQAMSGLLNTGAALAAGYNAVQQGSQPQTQNPASGYESGPYEPNSLAGLTQQGASLTGSTSNSLQGLSSGLDQYPIWTGNQFASGLTQ